MASHCLGALEASPWNSEQGEDDSLGGASGIGIGGFGLGDGNKIKVDDGDYFYPLSMIETTNYNNSFVASLSVDISWNLTLYNKLHDEVYSKNFVSTLTYWETLNYQTEEFLCPRASIGEGESVNDVAFNTRLHNEFTPYWPIFGLDDSYISDGQKDVAMCADALRLRNGGDVTDRFNVMSREYEVKFTGPYIYQEDVEGCPALNSLGLPDSAEKWDAKCFKKVDTFWADEQKTTRAFMRMSINKVQSI